MRTAKLFMNGRSQAVRLPADFRFEGDTVLIRRDPATGDVILSSPARRPIADWIALRDRLRAEQPAEFADFELERDEQPAPERDGL